MGWDGTGRDAREGMRALFAIERARAGDVRDRARAARGTDVRDRARGDPTRIARIAWARGWRVRDRGFDSTGIGVR
jgi:hypothetical protein